MRLEYGNSTKTNIRFYKESKHNHSKTKHKVSPYTKYIMQNDKMLGWLGSKHSNVKMQQCLLFVSISIVWYQKITWWNWFGAITGKWMMILILLMEYKGGDSRDKWNEHKSRWTETLAWPCCIGMLLALYGDNKTV